MNTATTTPLWSLADDLTAVGSGDIVLHDEKTRRSWRITVAPFLMSRHLVTQALYATLVPPNGDARRTSVDAARLPATDVSWNDATRFCNLLSQQEGLTPCYSAFVDEDATGVECDFTADGYRLPTEAEWEHACRAGSNDVRYGELDAIAWYRDNSADRLHAVGSKVPNAWGLYDMIGNAWEWCWDTFDPVVYGPYRVFRGGGYADPPRGCRASCRRKSHPTFRVEDVGFRLARSHRVGARPTQ